MTGHGAIDVHAHFVPPFYRDALLAHGHEHPDGFPHIPEWSASEHVAVMDRLGIATAMLSISSPGVHLAEGGDGADLADTAALTRAVNEAGRRAVVDHPGRFGQFASLPLPDIDAAVAEIAYCCDRLNVDGFALMTNVGGVYLGDPALEPVFAELNRRKARVFMHPTSPPCWQHTSLGRPRPMLEFLLDTTRCVVDMILNGVVARWDDVAFVVPHGGAALAMVADRVAVFAPRVAADPTTDVLADLARLHYDLAGYPVPRQLAALETIAPFEHLHYGSDYPFTPEVAVDANARRLADLDSGEEPFLARLAANSRGLLPTLQEQPTDAN